MPVELFGIPRAELLELPKSNNGIEDDVEVNVSSILKVFIPEQNGTEAL